MSARGHMSGAADLVHGKIVALRRADAEYPADTFSLSYCAGFHCNCAVRAAIRLAQLGRPVNVMIGGITGWLDEGFALAVGKRR
jgi:rhodanese-related sulfurtransferase